MYIPQLVVITLISFNFARKASSLGTGPTRLNPGGGAQASSFSPSLRSISTSQEIDQANTRQQTLFETIFDFSNPKAIDCFERIDDAIMGGISTSSIRHVLADDLDANSSHSFASWSGICRVDGGGFCGTRTLPFCEPIQVKNETDGFFLDIRLVSDDEPERRVWKMSTRMDQSRGEQLYQAEFKIPNRKEGSLTEEWSRIFVPFSDFRLVRGARFVPDGEFMNPSERGLFQIGLTLSKFRSAQNMTVMDNFRPGFFEVHIQRIGLYSRRGEEQGENYVDVSVASEPPTTLSKDYLQRNRPLFLKILSPLGKFFFSEEANRRRSAMKILLNQRGMSRLQAILYGIGIRSGKSGRIFATLQVGAIVFVDALRSIIRVLIRYGLFVPLSMLAKFKKSVKKV